MAQNSRVGDATGGPKTYNTSAGAGVRRSPGRSHAPVRPSDLPTGSPKAASDQSRHRLSQPAQSRRGGEDPHPPPGRTGGPVRSRDQPARSFRLRAMRSSGRPLPATGSTARPESAREARLRRHDAQPDGPWGVSGVCRSTSDLPVPAPGSPKDLAKTDVHDSSEDASQLKESPYGIPRGHRVDGSPDAPRGLRRRPRRARGTRRQGVRGDRRGVAPPRDTAGSRHVHAAPLSAGVLAAGRAASDGKRE